MSTHAISHPGMRFKVPVLLLGKSKSVVNNSLVLSYKALPSARRFLKVPGWIQQKSTNVMHLFGVEDILGNPRKCRAILLISFSIIGKASLNPKPCVI